MVKKILFIISLYVGSVTSFGQCETSATGFGNNSSISSYNVSGDVSITHQNNQLTFKTAANYSTAFGPDVRVYLVNSEGKSSQEIINTNINSMPNIPFGLVAFSGEQEIKIDVPNNVDLKEYDIVFFYCFQFSQFWDFGNIDLTNFDTCSLSVKSLEKKDYLKIYPNPTSDKITIEGDLSRYSKYKLIDIQGRVVKQSNDVSSVIYLENLPKGLYTLFLSSGTLYEVEKIIIN